MTADESPIPVPAVKDSSGEPPAAGPMTRRRGQHRERASGGRLLPLTAVLLVLCLAAAGFAAYFAVDRGGPAPAAATSLTSPAAQAATTAARRAVRDVLSYSYRTVGADVRRAESDSTGLFLRQYRSTASQLLSEAWQQKAIVQATVGSSGVVSAGPGDVVVLLFVDQATVRQPKGPTSNATRIDQSRVRVTMTRVGSRWLISQLAAL